MLGSGDTRERSRGLRRIQMTVDGKAHVAEVEPRLLLLHHLRENLGIGGVHTGCNTTSCGACTIHIDGESVKSCTVLAVQADGANVTTVQGIRDNGLWHPMQQAFHEAHGLQCGYCTPGMIMASISLLEEKPDANEAEIREGLEGNLCRCTGYENIVKAVQLVQKHSAATPAAS
ncbi:2Fe-2S iron-sulfur cluster binding domain-containing protein [Rubrobacter tropicus]|uniref:2Fe-2S iron-sulfur cluster binding domain-containing protein n=1 Tax=Rubrobacter tropicus TaxID=2653851 RepID=A0A6G8QEJ3_9ACTN|nr:2Fe-2S iron-sulfur cluster binding domain-containing protein [Rubrobacter tropicus]